MGWTRLTNLAERRRRRPQLESLEIRTLLSTSSGPKPTIPSAPLPAGSSNSASVTGTNVDQIVGASTVRSKFGVNGSGMSVADIGTGVNYDNPALGGGFGPGYKVVAGYDFSDNNPDPMATSSQHDTAVAGLIASSDPNHPGIAPGANLVALRVFGDSGTGSFTDVASALQWVIDNHSKYNITAVNLSLSDGNNYTHDWFTNDGGIGQKVEQLISQLDSLNIPVITADGNSFNGQQGIGFPAIDPQTINVTSTDASNQIVAGAQRLGSAAGGASATDLAAPGENNVAPSSGDSFTTVSGTSFAAPIVTGAVVLLQQIYESRFGHLPTVSDIKSWLEQGSDPIHDSATGITVGLLDIPKAATLIPGSSTPAQQDLTPPSTPSTTPPPSTTPTTPTTPPSTGTTTPSTPSNPTTPTPPPQSTTPPPSSSTTTTPPADDTPSPPPVENTPPPAQSSTPPPQNNTPPPSNSTPPPSTPPADNTPPPSNPTPPSTPTPTPRPTPSGPNVIVNGQSLGYVPTDQLPGALAGLVSLFSSFLTSVHVWGPGANSNETGTPVLTNVHYWTASVQSPQPAGVVNPPPSSNSASSGSHSIPGAAHATPNGPMHHFHRAGLVHRHRHR